MKTRIISVWWKDLADKIERSRVRFGTRQKALRYLIERKNSQLRGAILGDIYKGVTIKEICTKLSINIKTWEYYITYNASDEFKSEIRHAISLKREYIKESKVRKTLRGR